MLCGFHALSYKEFDVIARAKIIPIFQAHAKFKTSLHFAHAFRQMFQAAHRTTVQQAGVANEARLGITPGDAQCM